MFTPNDVNRNLSGESLAPNVTGWLPALGKIHSDGIAIRSNSATCGREHAGHDPALNPDRDTRSPRLIHPVSLGIFSAVLSAGREPIDSPQSPYRTNGLYVGNRGPFGTGGAPCARETRRRVTACGVKYGIEAGVNLALTSDFGDRVDRIEHF